MAEKNVVRQDVVQISWKVDNSELKKLNKMTKQIKESVGAMDKETQSTWNKMMKGANKVKNALTPLDDKINKIGRSALDAGKKFATGFGRVAKKAVVGLGAAIVSVTGLSVKAYADFEQLVGGVETLFKESKDIVVNYANNAYKTAGLSANAYMETVTSFSGSLLQSLNGDTAKAAHVADKAITDMSDNANKMGTAMESIQYAYQGFSKQNYTMLDNLKLGYGGTKEEMQRLLKDASKLAGRNFVITSYADVIEAIHVIQENMGIAGTTAKEASTTIQGSFSSMKSAWTNLLVGLADPSQNVDMLLENLVQSVVTFGKNLVPRIGIVLKTLTKELAPLLAKGAQDLALKVRNYLIENKGKIWEGFKTMMATGINMIYQLFTGENLDLEEVKGKIQSVADAVLKVATSIKEHWPAIKATVIGVAVAIGLLKTAMFACNAVLAINNGIMKAKQAIEIAAAAKTKILAAAQWAMNASLMGCPLTWIIAGIAALIAIIVVLVKNWDTVRETGTKCWGMLKESWSNVANWFDENVVTPIKELFDGLWGGISEKATAAIDKVKSIGSGVSGWVSDKVSAGKEWLGKFYARGTSGHPGGNAIVNDGRGAELVQLPNGRMFIPRGKNVLLPNAPKGMKVLNADLTAALMGAKKPTYNYARGTGSFTAPTYTPSGSISNSTSHTNTNNYSPSFTLNMSGTVDRTTERTIKRWVKEAMEDMFDSMSRTSPRLTEV
ncbi:MAG: hypothetical protein IKY67_06250 [Paludibacteraceae bacterium]|nr:hypothetical protein [Paludibacteraceae bacterium]